ncbi:hypothetical protein Pmar_PMAR000573 [Perkinsus marinus ATCC 50983]|uniref:Uncharacterized protein n=1 Tax=Perkinsus marinus (strain ATCC 50983 / TXsc) TaxID=423536 RepID=C5LJ01_PERM5|nr:hypothetical protein Pmar_PMAR000573 [Perkinsus marinus ATCC 50983]EER03336.1 hypothetical protein Pmar_PMAR000573 [Perkinsus marinus ATCC 50983]|eukprot:XP_002771520.1 hypothetical protein Pmar_PMAR000573 [Perkinsus marinus ATCC 50983]
MAVLLRRAKLALLTIGVSQKLTYTDLYTVLRTGFLKDDPIYQRLQRESPSTDGATLWRAAIDEVDNHTMAGPIDGDSYTTDYLISRRFPVRQVSKTRPCDDYTASGLNDCQYFDRPMALPTIDLITQMYNALSGSWPDDLDPHMEC